MAWHELERGSLEEAERYVVLAAEGLDSVPAARRGRSQVALAVVRLRVARQRGDLPAVAVQGIALAHRIGRPYLEATGLAHWAQVGWRSYPLEAQRSRQAIELAGRHGWAEEPVAGIAYVALGMTMVVQGRLQEAERSLEQAERTLRAEVEPAAGMRLRYARGLVDLGSGRPEAALAAFQAAEQLAGLLVTEHVMASRLRSHVLQTLMRLGQAQRAGADPRRDERPGARQRTHAQHRGGAPARPGRDPKAATVALAPIIDGSVPVPNTHHLSARAKSGCCATCPPGSPHPRSPTSSACRSTPSRPT